MTIFEMIIEVRQATQNIAANTRRKLQDEEIVWILNKIQERFIQSKIKRRKDGSGGFQLDQLDADAIRPLLTTKSLPHSFTEAEQEYEGQLPADYSYLISDDSKSYLLCGKAVTTSTVTEHALVIPFSTSKSSAPFYASVSITIGTTTITLDELKTFYSAAFTGTSSKAEKYIVIDALLWYIRNVRNIEVYWEKYEDIIAPQSFIFPNVTTGSITVDAQSAVNGIAKTVTRTIYDYALGNWHPNRLTPGDKVSTMLDTAFVKPSHLSSISELWGNKLIVHGEDSFIVTEMRIDYIKKPRRMNLSLAQDCELSEDFHMAICDLAVEYIKAMTADPNWQVKLQDNIARAIPIG